MELSFLVEACAGSMVFTAFLMASRVRLGSLAKLYALQSLLLAAAVTLFAFAHAEYALLTIVFLIVVLKVWLIPYWLLYTVRKEGMSERLLAYVRPATLSIAAFVVECFAAVIARALAPVSAPYVIVASSVALVLTGFLMLVSRRDMFGLGFGFLTVENGVFTLGFALIGGMPLVVEGGILFDLMVLFVLILALARRTHSSHASVATDYLTELTG